MKVVGLSRPELAQFCDNKINRSSIVALSLLCDLTVQEESVHQGEGEITEDQDGFKTNLGEEGFRNPS